MPLDNMSWVSDVGCKYSNTPSLKRESWMNSFIPLFPFYFFAFAINDVCLYWNAAWRAHTQC